MEGEFSFQYAVIRGEIYVYNVKGNISDIFWKVWDEDTIYVSLYHMNKKMISYKKNVLQN